MQVKSIAECPPLEHSAILLTFIKLPFVIKFFVLSIFEWTLNTGFTVFVCFVALRPKSTSMVMVGQSVHLTTLFPGQA